MLAVKERVRAGGSATYVVAAPDAPGYLQRYAHSVSRDNLSENLAFGLAKSYKSFALTEGTFPMPSQCPVTADQVFIRGEGKGTVVDLATAGQDGFVFGDGSTQNVRCGIANLRITSSATKNGGVAVRFRKQRFSFARDVFIEKQYHGVSFEGACVMNRLDGFEIMDAVASTGEGVRLLSAGGAYPIDVFLTNGLISANGGSEPNIGLHVKAVSGLYIANLDIVYQTYGCLVDPDGSGDLVQWLIANNLLADTCVNDGLIFSPGATYTVQGVRLVNPWGASSLDGLKVGGSGTVRDFKAIGGQFTNNKNHGVALWNGSHVLILGSTITDNGSAASNTYDGVSVAAGISDWRVAKCLIGALYYGARQKYGVNVNSGASDRYRIVDNTFVGNVTAPISDNGSGTDKRIKDNAGYRTEASGQASVTGAVDSVVVTHTLATTPTRVLVTPLQTGQGDFAVTARGATTFTISFVTQPGASTWYFDWRAVVGEGN